MDQSTTGQWLAVYHCLADGSYFSLQHFNLLLQKIGNPEEILATPVSVYEKAGMTAGFCKAVSSYQKGKSSVHQRVANDLEWQQDDTNHIINSGSPHYPALLAAIPDPPPLLYLQGNPRALTGSILAIVGSRKPSLSGKRLARRFARELAQSGITVCSGLAYGVDSESHHGTLEGDGCTIAVLGGGLCKLYPKANQSLAEAIIQSGGCILSEFPLDFPPRPWCFPIRNRVITGLSRGVLVVEATLKSGSLVSARCALEQGREVYAIPGHIDSPQTRGCHQLIREGACLVESVQDILSDRDDLLVCQNTHDEKASESLSGCSENEIRILEALGSEGQNTDSLARITGMDIPALSSLLGGLEIRGLVCRQGSIYCRS